MHTKAELIAWIKTFARPERGSPERFIVDEIDHEFYLVLDCEEGEGPESQDTCDVLLLRIRADDPLADAVRILCDADPFDVQRLFEAMKIKRLFPRQPPIPRL